jgi:hypothetical protein
MTNKSHLTAITRKSPSAPMKRLAADGRIVGKALDYGSGRGTCADEYGMAKFDPHYDPGYPGWSSFDTITCNYVLNVIEDDTERLNVLKRILGKLATDGTAYVTVRNDKRALRGTTSRGTWQGLILLRLPVVYRCAGFVTYELRKDDCIDESIMEARIDN